MKFKRLMTLIIFSVNWLLPATHAVQTAAFNQETVHAAVAATTPPQSTWTDPVGG